MDLCRLHFRTLDLISFYEKSGYKLFPTMNVEINARNEFYQSSPHTRLYDKDKDWHQCVELYNDFNEVYLGSLVWDPQYGNWNNNKRVVWDDGKGIAGYLYVDESLQSGGAPISI